MMILAGTGIENVPGTDVKNILIVLGFVVSLAINVFALLRRGDIQKREISGSIESKPAMEHADKASVIALTAAVEKLRADQDAKNQALQESITAQFNNAQRAGESRVSAITSDIDEQMRTLTGNLGKITDMITQALIDNASQGQAINDLKANHVEHQRQVAAIQRQISEMIMQGRKRPA